MTSVKWRGKTFLICLEEHWGELRGKDIRQMTNKNRLNLKRFTILTIKWKLKRLNVVVVLTHDDEEGGDEEEHY